MAYQEHVWIANFNANPNVGLYAYCTDTFCLVGKDVKKSDRERLSAILRVPVHPINIAGTGMLGAFLAGNSNALLLPSIAFEHELKELTRLGIKYQVIPTLHTALGNMILANDQGAIVSPEIEKELLDQISTALKVPVHTTTISGLENVGALAAVNKTHCLISLDATEPEITLIENTLKVQCMKGSLNTGLPYIHASLLVNSHGFVVSEQSTGIEIADADVAFGFIG